MANRRTKLQASVCGDTTFHSAITVVSNQRLSIQNRFVLAVLLFAVILIPAVASSGGNRGGVASEGRAVIERAGCLNCHSLDGSGGGSASDLAFRSIMYRQAPAETAAEMWNHAPKMWKLLTAEGKEIPTLSRSDAEDVYAFFRSARYFDLRGEVIRGKEVFTDKGCAGCHQIGFASEAEGRGPHVSEWTTQFDTAAWTSSLWNHARAMLREMEATGLGWPTISEQEMVDLLLYLRTSVGRRGPAKDLNLSDPRVGETVFEEKGCVDCHTLGGGASGKVDLAKTTRDARTMSGLAAAMWNHIPQMYDRSAREKRDLDSLTPDQVASLASYFYFKGSFSEAGNPTKGQTVFKKKGCITCHGPGQRPFPPPGGGRVNEPAMMSAVWTHGPSMLREMNDRGIEWPRFSEKEMENLIAFLNDGR
jgi:cytochrome c551/c552